MSEYLDPYEVAQAAIDDRNTTFEVTLTGTIYGLEIDSDEGVKISIAGQEVALHNEKWRTYGGPVINKAIKVRKVEQ